MKKLILYTLIIFTLGCSKEEISNSSVSKDVSIPINMFSLNGEKYTIGSNASEIALKNRVLEFRTGAGTSPSVHINFVIDSNRNKTIVRIARSNPNGLRDSIVYNSLGNIAIEKINSGASYYVKGKFTGRYTVEINHIFLF